MKFGKVESVAGIDLNLPKDHSDTIHVFESAKAQQNGLPPIYVGCAKWNKAELKGFYPRGVKDELAYYSTQFNCIELNASFYRIFPPEQFEKWKEKTPDGFKFFPKISQEISHFKQLNAVEEVVDRYLNSVIRLEEKLGTIFLQMHERFAPNRFEKLAHFVQIWPKEIPLTVELRHPDWYLDPIVGNELHDLLHSNGITFTLVDTAGRRDMVHMRMTTPQPFVRYVGANDPSDMERLTQWVDRIEKWVELGMNELHFFIHQNVELESPLLANQFIQLLNKRLGYDLHIPVLAQTKQKPSSPDLFS